MQLRFLGKILKEQFNLFSLLLKNGGEGERLKDMLNTENLEFKDLANNPTTHTENKKGRDHQEGV